MLPAVT